MRCYSIEFGEEYCFCVIADNVRKAKVIGLDNIQSEYNLTIGSDIEFTDVKVKWQKNTSKKQCEEYGCGVADDWVKALRIGIYNIVQIDCNVCGDYTSIEKWEDGFIGCEQCFDKQKKDVPSKWRKNNE